MSNSALQRQLDNKMVNFMLVCVGLILIAYMSIYTLMIITAIDPNIPVAKKEKDWEVIISIFLVVQFFTQLGQLIIFKRLGTNINESD
jgi:ABC-type multidrug transport system fused ATPase/permease subunit